MFRRLSMSPAASAPVNDRRPALDRWVRRVGLIGSAALAVALGTAAGLGSTALVLGDDDVPGAVQVGSWRFWPDAGRPDINPYLRARLALSGQVPLAAGEGVRAFAREDDQEQPLSQACDYRIAGPGQAALFWTIEAANEAGEPFDNPARRTGFTASDVLRDITGTFVIEAAPTARPGNWLPLPGAGRFVLVMHLYGVSRAASSPNNMQGLVFPTITRGRCGS